MNSLGERFRYFRKLFNLKQEDFALQTGANRASLSKIEANKQEVPEPILKVLEYRFQLNRDWLLEGEGDIFLREEDQKRAGDLVGQIRSDAVEVCEDDAAYLQNEFHLVPRYNIEAAGGEGSVIHSEQIVDHLAFREKWIRAELKVDPKRLALISAIGDSMEPSVRAGDLLLVDLGADRVRDDAIYCLQIDGNLVVKRVQWMPEGMLVVKSDNANYQQYTLSGDRLESLAVVGRVVWIGRRV